MHPCLPGSPIGFPSDDKLPMQAPQSGDLEQETHLPNDSCRVEPFSEDAQEKGRVCTETHLVDSSLSGSQELRASESDRPAMAPINSIERAGRTYIEKDILRGALLHRTLTGFGKFWRYAPSNLKDHHRKALWQVSQPVSEIDVFLSHTWMTVGWKKVLSLMTRYGRGYYFSFALLVCMTVFPLAVMQTLPIFCKTCTGFHSLPHWNFEGRWPGGIWCTACTPPLILVSLVFWPMLPGCLQKTTLVFLDVLCINQVDKQLMTEGIYSLGGFVTNSKQMLILWDRDYLKRKWCMFELASFLGTQGERSIKFAPVYVETSVLLLFVVVWVVTSAYKVLAMNGLPWMAALASGLLLLPFGLHSLRKNMKAKHVFLNDLRTFDVSESVCRSDFDSEYIDTAIAAWWGEKEKFNEHVKTTVGDIVAAGAGSIDLPWHYAVLATFPAGVLHSLDEIATSWASGVPWQAILLYAFLGVGTGLGFFPSVAKFAFMFAGWSTSGVGKESRCASVLWSVGFSFCIFLLVAFHGFTSFPILTTDWPYAILPYSCLQTLVAVFLWRSSLAEWFKNQASSNRLGLQSAVGDHSRKSWIGVEMAKLKKGSSAESKKLDVVPRGQ